MRGPHERRQHHHTAGPAAAVAQVVEAFDELSLERSGRPLNPMINAGAITAHSLVGSAGLGPEERLARVVAVMRLEHAAGQRRARNWLAR